MREGLAYIGDAPCLLEVSASRAKKIYVFRIVDAG